MNGAKAQKLGFGQAGNHAEHSRLFSNAQTRLEADQIPHATTAVLHAQLYDGVGT